MKIIIVGGGIGGLAAYLALEKYLSPVTIKVYESYPDPASTTSIIGGGLSLAPNGLRTIQSLCPEAAKNIEAEGFHAPVQTLRNSQGQLLGQLTTGRKEQHGFDQIFLARATVHRALIKELPEGAVEWGRKVTSLKETDEGVEIYFEDGGVENADLVIGADGVRSRIRETILGGGYEAEYQGLTGVGGFIPIPQGLSEGLKESPVTMTFGPQGFFGYAPSTSSALEPSEGNTKKDIMWWSTYEIPTPPKRDTVLADIRTQLQERHGFWTSPHDSRDVRIFQSIISTACGADTEDPSVNAVEKGVLVLPRYLTPRLPRWCTPSGKIILLGDAAHAMPPDSGQGVSCAAEDGLAIALLLRHYLEQCPTTTKSGALDIAEVLKRTRVGYETIRMPRVHMILDRARHTGNLKKKMTWFEEKIRDWFIWIFCQCNPDHFVASVIRPFDGKIRFDINRGVFSYDVEVEVPKYLSRPNLS